MDATTAFSMAALNAALPSVPSSKTRSTRVCSRAASGVDLRRSASVSLKPMTATKCVGFQPFDGLRNQNALQLRADVNLGVMGLGISNGAKWFAMRHGRKIHRLGRPADQRRALLRGLTTEILRHGRIKTTRARATAMRKYVDHMITLAKGGSLHQRRQALGFLYDKQLVHSLFAEVPERYGERNGGYTRIIRTMPRKGDNAPMAFIELV
ncbi:large ribosomal subunit protein bL17c [Physcomitrium patens]|uniref:Large ribosomal subunit protein bL17c n=1 Tax=Physcomitrium patens TaxID=3218 RepID=A0A2K1KU99_PHYPA|nr:50S ribosomal protein L17, chloroplastic-like [Physcomitrium patens]PNR57330.1 hypothetical protein PHYPA_004324 [Physcomitrium patens]|eukprot:XP_024369634.1 50S ribosomal protein L17, chloroplastic-like [Physcomitrella patens]